MKLRKHKQYTSSSYVIICLYSLLRVRVEKKNYKKKKRKSKNTHMFNKDVRMCSLLVCHIDMYKIHIKYV